ncbi:DUF3219 family protein [Bacillaceae bacterium Marseille-Q3522]|nr:DUF3219 family protein [Bacillaceae bacterium Marseille-Q3522]
MVEIFLNNTPIVADDYKEEKINNLLKISFKFKVTSEAYHDITTLLYKGTFTVKVLDRNLAFTGTIQQYSTSVTNLYAKGQTGEFSLSLVEVKEKESGIG